MKLQINLEVSVLLWRLMPRRREDGSGWNIYKNGGRVDVGIDAVEWAMKVCELGAGEILLTSMDCDGTKAGYDIELTQNHCRKCAGAGDCIRRSRYIGAF